MWNESSSVQRKWIASKLECCDFSPLGNSTSCTDVYKQPLTEDCLNKIVDWLNFGLIEFLVLATILVILLLIDLVITPLLFFSIPTKEEFGSGIIGLWMSSEEGGSFVDKDVD
eukprot:TRINITY_DN13464_c0_g3_i3.p1 TRINITY_DN13464_c0_g3~~TRINITY_DN13464_c0_g3_i3.p1  ORF type:complete len:113 (-),score=18.11 TRINITY_DN13464_c0_g3_i3:331-669(-)